jgi:DNA repair protein RadC
MPPSRARIPEHLPPYREILDAFTGYIAEDRPCVDSPGAAAELMRPLLAGRTREEFWVLLLDTKNRLIAAEQITVGLLDRSPIHAREVFREAVSRSCSRLILLHNHPSGDPCPSAEDISSTQSLAAAGKIIGIEVLDHVVVGERTPSRERFWTSLREQGLL